MLIFKHERVSKMAKKKPMDGHTIGILEKRWEDATINCHDTCVRLAQYESDVYAKFEKAYDAEIDAACKLARAMYSRGLIGLIADKLRLENDADVKDYLKGENKARLIMAQPPTRSRNPTTTAARKKGTKWTKSR